MPQNAYHPQALPLSQVGVKIGYFFIKKNIQKMHQLHSDVSALLTQSYKGSIPNPIAKQQLTKDQEIKKRQKGFKCIQFACERNQK